MEAVITKAELIGVMKCDVCKTVRRHGETIQLIDLGETTHSLFVGCKKCDEIYSIPKNEKNIYIENERNSDDEDFFEASKVAMNVILKLEI